MSLRPTRQALVVLGMHRSGTSAVAGCLQRLGVEFGPRLMPATGANERGYYEHVDVVNLHDRLLMALGRGWDSAAPWPARWWEDEVRTGRFRAELLALLQRDFGAAPLWGIKDPRLCRLLPWWEPLWELLDTRPVYLIVVRDPPEVAASLRRREGISTTKGLVLWLQHLTEAERATRGKPRCFLNFRTFMEEGAGSLEPLGSYLDGEWAEKLSAGRTAIAGFLDARLLRASPPPDHPDQALPSWLKSVARLFANVCNGEQQSFAGELDRSLGELETAKPLDVQPAAESLSDAALELANARKLGFWYEAEWYKNQLRAGNYRMRLQKPGGKAEPRASVRLQE